MQAIAIALYLFAGIILLTLGIQFSCFIWMLFSVWYEKKCSIRSKYDIRTWFAKI